MGQGRINMKFLQEIQTMIAEEVRAHIQTEMMSRSQMQSSTNMSVASALSEQVLPAK